MQEFPGRIGLMGGDPTLHPKFDEICKIYEEMIQEGREKFGQAVLIGPKKDLIFKVFDEDRLTYNDHSTPGGKHTPLFSINRRSS